MSTPCEGDTNHADHVGLIREGVRGAGGEWADLGSGEGAFTLALADILGPGATIHSVDRGHGALRRQRHAMSERFPATRVRYLEADFTQPLDLPPLDGIVMANSLHFVRAKEEALRHIAALLRPGGRLVLVEYDADQGNAWVPHPISYQSWEKLSARSGFVGTRLLQRVPSRFLGHIYSAMSSLGPPGEP
ncbi:MAG TPA: class I SAM-dependent methyltransferase [Actinomycetota bacterium]|nr:class I SAM-dependent methyltransferase [Actinomycetota bacterium]